MKTQLLFAMFVVTALAQVETQADCPGSFPGKNIAVNAQKPSDISSGANKVLTYTQILLNEGAAFVDKKTFVTPCPGIYHLSVSFVKDGFKNNGTTNDVRVYFTKNGVKTIINPAWSAEALIRSQAFTEAAIRLKAGDKIQTWIEGDEHRNETRNVINLSLTIYRIGN